MTLREIDRSTKAFAIVVIVTALVTVRPAESSSAEPVSIDHVISAWKERQQSIKTLDYAWKSQHFAATPQTPPGRQKDPAAQSNATEGSIAPTQMRYVVDERGRIRLESHGREWSNERGAYEPQELIDIFDGKRRNQLFLQGAVDFPNAHISQKPRPGVARNAQALPIRLAFRPFDPLMGVVDPGDISSTGKKALCDGRRCAVLTIPDGSIWVDPEREFLPLRYLWNGSSASQDVQIEYVKDQMDQWTPISWTYARVARDGSILDSVSSRVVSVRLNEPVPDSMFTIEYPEGTWVRDYTTGERYILRNGGERRPILKGEFNGKNYRQLLRTDPPPPFDEPTPFRIIMLWVLAMHIFVGILLGGAWIFRAYRRRTV